MTVHLGPLIVVAGAALTLPAAAEVVEDLSANPVFLGCKAYVEDRVTSGKLAMTANFCAGVVHGLVGAARYRSDSEWRSCAPPAAETRQLVRVVVKFIEANPERMHEDFRGLALEALHRAWPCKSG